MMSIPVTQSKVAVLAETIRPSESLLVGSADGGRENKNMGYSLLITRNRALRDRGLLLISSILGFIAFLVKSEKLAGESAAPVTESFAEVESSRNLRFTILSSNE